MKRFEDTLNTAVFTTSFVVKDSHEITYVTHDSEDGAWQFFSNDEFDNYDDVAMLVSLEEILKIDQSVLEIADMPIGYYASRESKIDSWVINKNGNE